MRKPVRKRRATGGRKAAKRGATKKKAKKPARKTARRVSARRKPPKRKVARRRTLKKRKATRRKPAKRKVAKRKTPKRRVAKRKVTKRKTPKRRVAKRKVTKRKTPKRRVAKRKVSKRKTPKRSVAKRKVTKRKTPKRRVAKRRTAARKAVARRPASRRAAPRVPASKARRAPAVKPPFESYKGSKPYIFISYSHGDMREVFTLIRKLSDSRFRVWYDEGIEPGVEWPEVVGKAILRSRQFLVFMSPAAAGSRNVRNEINLAHAEGRRIIAVFLRETRLSEGMKLQIGTVQHVNRFDMTEREFLNKLSRVLPSELRG